jgi:uncharacterized membrane protein
VSAIERQPRRPHSAPRRLTSATLSAGVGLSAICFLVAGLAELLGIATSPAEVGDLGAVVGGLGSFDRWAWASLGTLIVLVTPGIGLVVTAVEYTRVAERGSALMAVTILIVLVVSALLAFMR